MTCNYLTAHRWRCQRQAKYHVPALGDKYPRVYLNGFLCGHHTPTAFRTNEYRIEIRGTSQEPLSTEAGRQIVQHKEKEEAE